MPVLGALAAWGYEWAWGRPREGEAIDIGAILRSPPGCRRRAGDARGLRGADRHRQRRRDYVLIADGGEVRIEEREAPDADARVSGVQRSWIEAFAPDGSLDALEIEGDRRLAETLLGVLRNEVPRRAAAAA